MSLLEIARRWDVVDELERDGTAAQLRAVAATLTPEEHQRLAAEAARGDRLALYVLGALLVVWCPSCGGDRWHPARDDDLERCVACGAPASFTVLATTGR